MYLREQKPLRFFQIGAILIASAFTLSSAAAQTLSEQTRRVSAGDGPAHVVSVNPFLPLFGFFSGEYEQRATPTVTFAVSGSHIEPNSTRYTNLDGKLRLYPNATALRGFNIAASLGVARIRDMEVYNDCIPTPNLEPCALRDAFTTGSFAVEMGYQWLLGPNRVTAISVGGGAKRYLGSDSKYADIARVLPTLRLTVGYAF